MKVVRTRKDNRTRFELRDESVAEGRLSGLSLVHLKMQIGSTVVRLGGIAGVSTPRPHRRKGYARMVMEDARAFMAAKRWEMALLYGIRDFYPKFGYAVSMPGTWFSVRTRDAERAGLRHRVRKMKAADKKDILRIYRASNSGRTGVCVRDPRWWKPGRKGSRWHVSSLVKIFTDKRGKVAGYMMLDDDDERTEVAEAGAASRECYESILATAARDAIEKRCGELTVWSPLDHPLFEVAGRFGARGTIRLNRSGGALARIIDQQRLFETIAPELSLRACSAGLSKWRGAVTVRTELGESSLKLAGGRVSVAAGRARAKRMVSLELPQPALTQLVMGFRSAADVLSTEGVAVEGDGAEEILAGLFPCGQPHMWQPDHF